MENKTAKDDPSRPKRSILMRFVLGFMAFCVYKWVVVDRMGFCYQRLWFVSSEELILKTIGGLMKSGRMKLDVADTSPRAYFAHHPNCCSVNWGGDGSFDRGLIYFGSASVSVMYEMSEAENVRIGSSAKKYYFEYVSNETACGETLGNTGIGGEIPVEHELAPRK